ncbi:MAG: hypothetical protein JW974_01475 [Alphaproteobacteria bacterium]|nr:hypothetical protein [Alphaproteobacteria bacterium]MBN2675453.1 hypothetical protein [Alphaproteobacteria bacterium]
MNKKLLILSLPYILSIIPISGWADIRVGNHSRSYADDYNQVAALQQSQYTVSTDSLPVRVANTDLATRIANGDTTANINVSNLESCANIYPGGSFAWDTPTAGLKAGNSSTCIAVVEMRVVKGTSDIIVARANIASGDSIKCNISEFPESSYTVEAGNVIFPADTEPTMDDVIKVMNNEQKKNAGFKIAAGAVVGGLLGNAAGKNDLGESGLIGTSDSKVKGTAIGLLSGAALMAGSAYSGKVGGDVIMSAGVNAAAGGVVGNMVSNGDSALRIEDCLDLNGYNTKCLWGIIEKNKPLDYATEIGFYNINTSKTMVCKSDYSGCNEERLIAISFGTEKDDYKSVEQGATDQGFLKIRKNKDKQFTYDGKVMTQGYTNDPGGIWTPIASAGRPGERINAMIPDFKDKTFGAKISDWYKWRNENMANAVIIGRNNKGESTVKLDENIMDFYPITVDASDGGLIDINNKARMKSTVVGAGAGAGIGAFTAYQGANDEIDARWISAVTEYKDSLQKVYCATGTRFLSQYNDLAIIPNMQ